MPHLDRDGVRIRFDVRGAGPPVLLSHGYTATSDMWEPQREALTGAGYQLVTWDMRGHGDSDYPADPSQYAEELAVADMAAILDEVGADRAVVGGLSLGGYLSLAFHLRHPGRVMALMLFDTGPGFKRDTARDAWNETAEDFARDFSARGLAALPQRAEVSRSHRGVDGLIAAARGLLTQRDARIIESLPDVAVPTLVLVGADDEGFLASSDYMAAKIPGATKAVLAGAGHAANLDQPDAFNRHVLDFLTSAVPV